VNRELSGIPPDVIGAYGLRADSARPIADGHINQTWRIRDRAGHTTILQQVNAVFPATVNDTIDAVTRHLERRGLVTPRLIPSQSGQLYVEAAAGIWRLQTEVRGRTRLRIASSAEAFAAGRLLGRFHAALTDFDRPIPATRAAAHDLERHLQALQAALLAHPEHRHRQPIAALAAKVLERAGGLSPMPALPSRVVHGDPKITNLLFAEDSDEGVCLIDLDTLAEMPIALELGDALRSWCNTADEDSPAADFSLPLFAAAYRGYAAAAADLLRADELRAIPAATERIAVELAARFLTDALNERYFGWDQARFESASQHNQARAQAQLGLAVSIAGHREAMRAAIG
jgi:Ser/Thr protein kinase RdoA (MazF antagonist)